MTLRNPQKKLYFSHKRNRQDKPLLFFNNIKANQVNDHKQRDLTLHSNLAFVTHISEKLLKARKGVGVIKYLSSSVPIKTIDRAIQCSFGRI